MLKDLHRIGTVELVSLPDDGVEHIPAKIDTGADSSAIWASDINVQDGKLTFRFFGMGSENYSAKPVVTTAFKTTNVKNSFGHEEFRYKIKLRIQIGNKTFRTWFS